MLGLKCYFSVFFDDLCYLQMALQKFLLVLLNVLAYGLIQMKLLVAQLCFFLTVFDTLFVDAGHFLIQNGDRLGER